MFDDGRPPRDCPDGSHSPTFVTKAGDDQSFTAAEGAHLGVTAALASSPRYARATQTDARAKKPSQPPHERARRNPPGLLVTLSRSLLP